MREKQKQAVRLARKGRGGDGEGVRGELGGGRERDGWLSAEEKRWLLPETGQPGDGGRPPKAGQGHR